MSAPGQGRDAVLGTLRARLGRRDGDGGAEAVAARIDSPARGPIPARGAGDRAARWGLGIWALFARRPWLYHAVTALAGPALRVMAGGRGRFRRLPLAAGWTDYRDFPAPEGRTFHQLWAQRRKERQKGRQP